MPWLIVYLEKTSTLFCPQLHNGSITHHYLRKYFILQRQWKCALHWAFHYSLVQAEWLIAGICRRFVEKNFVWRFWSLAYNMQVLNYTNKCNKTKKAMWIFKYFNAERQIILTYEIFICRFCDHTMMSPQISDVIHH